MTRVLTNVIRTQEGQLVIFRQKLPANNTNQTMLTNQEAKKKENCHILKIDVEKSSKIVEKIVY